MSDIPKRCRSCAHWVGRYTGNSEDTRCNRNYGHLEELGHFYDPATMRQEAYGHPAYVEHKCKRPRWGLPLPLVDGHGRSVAPPSTPPMVDAYLPALPREEEGIFRSVPVVLRTPHGDLTVNSKQLHQYLMASASQKEKLANRFKARDKKRKKTAKQHQKTYKNMYGTTPQVLEGMDQLPPFRRSLEKVPTGLYPLDEALNGGIPVGARVNISGKPDSGKSTLVHSIEGAFVRYYRSKVYNFFLNEMGASEEEAKAHASREKIGLIKPESFEVEYMLRALNLGNREKSKALFNQHCDILATNFAEESTQYVISCLNSDSIDNQDLRGPDTYSYMIPNQYRLFTLDSIDADELAEDSFGKGMKEKSMGENSRIAAGARLLAEFFRKAYKAAEIPVTLLMVSQERTTNIQFRASTSVHRGKAHPYFTNLEMNLYSPKMKPGDSTKKIICRFGKVHVDASVKEGDEIELALRPGHGIKIGDNLIPKGFDVGALNQAGSWITFVDLKGEEHKNQGTDEVTISDWLRGEGLLGDLQAQLRGEKPGSQAEEDGES